MAYTTDYQNAQDATFRARVAIAMLNAAIAISAESSSGTAGHVARMALATNVLSAPDRWMPLFALAAVSDDATGPSATDAQIQNRVNSIWDAVAGFDPN